MSESKLTLHCGARQVERAELASVPTPAATETWFPVGHAAVIDTVERSLTDAGFQVRSMQFGLARSDARMFAVANLETPLVPGVALAVGIRNSLDKSLPLGFCAGSRTFVCDNLAFRSDLTVARKHTRHGQARFVEAIALAVRTLAQFRTHEAERIGRLQEAGMDDRTAEALMLRSFERGLVSHRLLRGVIREWRSPSYPAFEAMNAWRLLNAFTTVLADRQKSNPQAHAAQTMAIGGFLDEDLGIRPFTPAPAAEEGTVNAQAT